jgi:hypothetical protein
MKGKVLALFTVFVSLGFLLSGTQTMTGYYAEPSGYGFYHIWFANMYVSLSFILLGSVAMFFLVKKIDKRLF